MRLARCGLAALIFALPVESRAQSLADAQAFVGKLYAAYPSDDVHSGPDYLGRRARTVFAPRLLSLVRLDAARTPTGDVGALDGDPICDCQDSGELRVVDLKVTRNGVGRAVATVVLRFPHESRALRLDLVSIRGRWRIDDIHSKDTPSLARFLQRHAGGR